VAGVTEENREKRGSPFGGWAVLRPAFSQSAVVVVGAESLGGSLGRGGGLTPPSPPGGPFGVQDFPHQSPPALGGPDGRDLKPGASCPLSPSAVR